jgi:hypothetical protein
MPSTKSAQKHPKDACALDDAKYKYDILDNICYTELVYDRIGKKLKSALSKAQTQVKIFEIIRETDEVDFRRLGKNIYITNIKHNIRITINSKTFRVITVDILQKMKSYAQT